MPAYSFDNYMYETDSNRTRQDDLTRKIASNSSFSLTFSSAEANSIFCPSEVSIRFKSLLLSASSALLLSPSISSFGSVRDRISDEGRRGRGTNRLVWLLGWFWVAMEARMCDSRRTIH